MSLTQTERAPLVTDAIPPSLRQRGANQRQVLAIYLVGALALACFASSDTPGWAERLGDSPVDHELRGITGSWDAAMEQLGLTRPHEALRDTARRWLDAAW